jgi:RimJ/RimL family protein N-acetyltransferase
MKFAVSRAGDLEASEINGLAIQIKSPGDRTPQELRIFEQLVCAGGEVTTNGLGGLILSAEKLLFASKEKVIGTCGIKRPNLHYKNNVFQKAGSSDSDNVYVVELGWVYVSPRFRKKGIGRFLIQSAMAAVKGKNCFATTRAGNAAMHALLKRAGFVKRGNDYRSGNGEYLLSLFVKG